jgi:hypothetical protein
MERERKQSPADARRTLGRLLQAVLASRAEANSVFDILAVLQVRDLGGGCASKVLRAGGGSGWEA